MGFLQSLGVLPLVDFAIQQGRGAAASVLGSTYSVFRLSDTTNVGIVSGSPVLSGYPALIDESRASKAVIRNAAFELLVYEVVCNNDVLQVGDVLVESGFKSDSGIYTYVQQRPAQASLFVRTEFNIAITRATTRAGSSSQQPESGVTSQTQRAGTFKGNERVLTLVNGDYSLQSSGATPANIPAGLQQLNRVRDATKPGIPTRPYREHFIAYLPLMPGFRVVEEDILNFPESDRYEVMSVFTSAGVGLQGYICIVEKIGP